MLNDLTRKEIDIQISLGTIAWYQVMIGPKYFRNVLAVSKGDAEQQVLAFFRGKDAPGGAWRVHELPWPIDDYDKIQWALKN